MKLRNIKTFFHNYANLKLDATEDLMRELTREDQIYCLALTPFAALAYACWGIFDYLFLDTIPPSLILMRFLVPLILLIGEVFAFNPKYFPSAKLFLTHLTAGSLAYMCAIIPNRVLGLYVSGHIMTILAMSALMLWNRKEYLIFAGSIFTVQITLALIFGRTANELFYLFIVNLTILMLGAAAAFIRRRSFHLSYHYKQQIKNEKNRIEAVVQSIDDCIVSIGQSGEIETIFEDKLAKLIGNTSTKVNGSEAVTYLFGNAGFSSVKIDQIRECIGSILGQDSIGFLMNKHQLPSEIFHKDSNNEIDKIISFKWYPLINENTLETEKLILTLRDETEKYSLDSQKQKESQKADEYTRLLRELAVSNINQAASVINQAYALSDNSLAFTEKIRTFSEETSITEDQSKELLRNLHTIKGTSRIVGLTSLSEAIHEAEMGVVFLSNEYKNEDPKTFYAYANRIEDFVSKVKKYQTIIEQIFHKPTSTPKVSSIGSIANDVISKVREHLASHGIGELNIRIEETCDRSLNEKERADLEVLLVHALFNAADHGFIFPLEKNSKAATRSPKISIHFSLIANRIQCSIEDNGTGLDWPKIEELAREKNFTPQLGENLASVLFLDKVSTSEKVSNTSGRGVGLSVIWNKVHALKSGSVTLSDRSFKQPGTKLTACWTSTSDEDKEALPTSIAS